MAVFWVFVYLFFGWAYCGFFLDEVIFVACFFVNIGVLNLLKKSGFFRTFSDLDMRGFIFG